MKDVEKECQEYQSYLNEFVENQLKLKRRAFAQKAAISIQSDLNQFPVFQAEKQRFHLLQHITDCLENTEIRLQKEEAVDASRHDLLVSNTNGTKCDSDRFRSQAAIGNELASSNEGKTTKKNNRKKKLQPY